MFISLYHHVCHVIMRLSRLSSGMAREACARINRRARLLVSLERVVSIAEAHIILPLGGDV